MTRTFGEEEEEKSIHNHNQGALMTTPDSLSPSSEPPDINNWFSSYEYESFVLETNDNFGFSESQRYEKADRIPEPRELVTNDDHSEEENKCANQVSDSPSLSPAEESEPQGIENWFSSYAYESPALETMDDSLCDHKESTVGCNEEQQRKEVKNGPSKNLPELPPTHSANLNSPATSLKANENGFVTVKSKRENIIRGNVKRTSCTPSLNDSIKAGDTEKVPMKRKTLADVTNVNAEHLPSVIGKWKCPRKSKPDTGPPLKQLRLGQWFHRQ